MTCHVHSAVGEMCVGGEDRFGRRGQRCEGKTRHGCGRQDRRGSGRVRLPFFVYGTLRPGEHNHDLFLPGRTRREEPGLLPGAVLYDGPGYPYAVEQDGGTVTGEIVTTLPEAYGELLAAL